MKKQLKSILLFIAVTFIILTGCSKSDSLVPPAVYNSPGQNTDQTTTKSASTPTSVIAKADNKAAKRTMVTITAPFIDIGTYPIYPGTFTTTGALNISGTATMDANFNADFTIAHCIITLTDNYGTITIHEECQFVTIPHNGTWRIVSGTGAYANLRGHGSNTMSGPDELEEDLVGVIHKNREESEDHD
jgi:hypothetical protein